MADFALPEITVTAPAFDFSNFGAGGFSFPLTFGVFGAQAISPEQWQDMLGLPPTSTPPKPPAPEKAFVEPPGGLITLLPEMTVTAVRAPSIAEASVTIASRLALGVGSIASLAFGLLFPSSIGAEPNVVRYKPRVAKPTTTKETTLSEVVVTAPRTQRVGKTSSIDYFADRFDADLDLLSNLTLDIKEPSLWTEPSTAPSKSPLKQPRTPTRPASAPSPVSSPRPTARPSLTTAPLPLSWPSTSPVGRVSPSPWSLPESFTIGEPTTTLQPQTRPQRSPKPSFGNPLTEPLTSPEAGPVESAPTKSDKCECPAKSKSEEQDKRTQCWVTLVKERSDPAADVKRKWRKIKCQ